MKRDFYNILVQASVHNPIDIERVYYEIPDVDSTMDGYTMDKNILEQWIKDNKDNALKQIAQDIRNGKIKVTFEVADYDISKMDEKDIKKIYKIKENE